MQRRIAPAAIHALKEALTLVYWYKRDLRSFLSQCLSDSRVLSRLNWSEYKRNIVATLVDHLATNERVYQDDLIRLMSEVCRITDYSHLLKVEDGKTKAQDAKAAVDALRIQFEGHQEIVTEQKKVEERQKRATKRLKQVNAVQNELENLKVNFNSLVSSDDPQKRGYDLEDFLKQIFDLFDLDSRAAFKIKGEQIDGSFSFEGTDYLVEAKWVDRLVSASDLDSFAGKVLRKLDNTLGLFVSINGFSSDAVETHTSGRLLLVLMDGKDLMAVLEGRIGLDELIRRKRRNAAATGNIYTSIDDIL